MQPSNRPIPESLRSYVENPQLNGLILLTSVLNASNNWLILRYLHSLLPGTGVRGPALSEYQDNYNVVIFLSLLRSWDFWEECSRKIVLSFFASNSNKSN
jgi:elongator complex protein 6